MAGPIARNYKRGSIIYFEGDVNDEIYILKEGRVILISPLLESGKEQKEEVQAGEFFGVKSSLGHFPREETAQTITDTTVLVMRPPDFEALMGKNFRLVMKMLRVFSNQLRDVGKRVRKILGDVEIRNPSTELLKLAEYYFQNHKLDYAKYAYKKFLEVYSNHNFQARAQEMVALLDRGQPYPGRMPALYEVEQVEQVSNVSNVVSSGSAKSATILSPVKPSSANITAKLGKQEFGGEFSLDSNDIPFDFGDPFAPDADSSSSANLTESDIAKWEKELANGNGNAVTQMERLAQTLRQKNNLDNNDKENLAKIALLVGRFYFDKKNLAKANEHLSSIVKELSQTSSLKPAMLLLGKLYHSAGKADTARGLYQKVQSMTPHDHWNEEARELMARLGA